MWLHGHDKNTKIKTQLSELTHFLINLYTSNFRSDHLQKISDDMVKDCKMEVYGVNVDLVMTYNSQWVYLTTSADDMYKKGQRPLIVEKTQGLQFTLYYEHLCYIQT